MQYLNAMTLGEKEREFVCFFCHVFFLLFFFQNKCAGDSAVLEPIFSSLSLVRFPYVLAKTPRHHLASNVFNNGRSGNGYFNESLQYFMAIANGANVRFSDVLFVDFLDASINILDTIVCNEKKNYFLKRKK